MARTPKTSYPAPTHTTIKIPLLSEDLDIPIVDGHVYTQVLLPPTIHLDIHLYQIIKNYIQTYHPTLLSPYQGQVRAFQVSHQKSPTKS